MEQTFIQTIEGYYLEKNKSGLPSKSGVYFVYERTYNATTDKVALKKLIYIGESADVNARVGSHEKQKDWEKYVGVGNTLCYSYTLVDGLNRTRVEAAYINRHKPPVNTEYADAFPFDKTIVKSTGKTALLDEFFVVNRKTNLV